VEKEAEVQAPSAFREGIVDVKNYKSDYGPCDGSGQLWASAMKEFIK